MVIRKLLRNRGLGVNLIAGFSFILLAVYAWGLSWAELGAYLLVILVFLLGLIIAAALCGWILRKLMTKSEWNPVEPDQNVKIEKRQSAEKLGSSSRDESGTKPDAK
ncbi:hypothetical protein O59_001480 [Cellvibrio sp. BR]|uniref:hypothetical protein n=1 Tax=Cellvibrio sp. BR TaxID=1134474 RepID=UPI0002601491|nr:hypothetical protein [Cellvibrio sp. BR]EIK45841.1 hypothetical protein O59_001480 [Cellvibrio sp. BR]